MENFTINLVKLPMKEAGMKTSSKDLVPIFINPGKLYN